MKDKDKEDKASRIEELHAGGRVGPYDLQLNLTNRCNLKCRFCWERDEGRVSHEGELSDEKYFQIVDEAEQLQVRTITITGGGEPLVRKGLIMKLVKKIKDAGIDGTLITNGTLMDEGAANALVESRWNQVIISLDSPDARTNDYLKGVEGSFEKTVNAIRLIDKTKKEHKSNFPNICVHYVLTNKNHLQVAEMVRFISGLNVESFFVEPVVNLCETTDIGEELKLKSREQLMEAEKQIWEGTRLCYKKRIDENLSTLSLELIESVNAMKSRIELENRESREKTGVAEEINQGLHGMICFEPSLKMIIRPNGMVGPCCMHDFNSVSVKDNTLSDIWFGKEFQESREAMKKGVLPEICQQCNPGQFVSNQKIREALKELKERKIDELAESGHLPMPQKGTSPMNPADPSIVKSVIRWNDEPQPPLILDINPTDYCNLRCKSCWQRNRKFRKLDSKQYELPDARLLSLIEEAGELGVKTVMITGGGEPLMRPVTADMIRAVKRLSMEGRLTTNGTMLTEKLAEELVDIGWDHVVFSIDGATAEVNDKLRGKGSFSKVLRSLELIKQCKTRKGASLPRISFNTVVSRTNHNRLRELVSLASEVGAESVMFEPLTVHSWRGMLMKIGRNGMRRMQESIPAISRLSAELRVHTNIESLSRKEFIEKSNSMDEVITRTGSAAQGKLSETYCLEPWYHIAVKVDGSAGPCCIVDEKRLNVKASSLREIWYGELFSNMREQMRKGSLPSWCRICNAGQVSQNESIREALKGMEGREGRTDKKLD